MPCLFGGIECDPKILDRLEEEMASIWDIRVHRPTEASLMGGHAFKSEDSLYSLPGGALVGLDGEASFYTAFHGAQDREGLPVQWGSGTISLQSPAVGNVAILDGNVLYLISDWTGSIPLYYVRQGDGLVFSSHLRPLARAISAEPDPPGIYQYLRDGFTIGSRTQFKGVDRLRGGEALVLSSPGELKTRETSEAWKGHDPGFSDGKVVADQTQGALLDVFRSLPRGEHPPALMMSAGWDSRTLLALASSREDFRGLTCYSHGDPASRELDLARTIARSRETVWRAEPLDSDLYDLQELHSLFQRTETAVFPHWHRAASLLREDGVDLILAGVFGEMLGGRYWAAHASSGVRKGLALFSELLRQRPPAPVPAEEARTGALELFRWRTLRRPWYVASGVLPDPGAVLAEINGDLEETFHRYERRGVGTLNQFAEAFQGEHIGSRYCNVQLLSCRSRSDVAFPLADRRVLSIVTRAPIHARMQNQLNREIIKNLDPELLRHPMAATLLPASAPIILQEASRVVRKGIEGGGWVLHFASGRRIPPTRLGWGDYEFLRDGGALGRVVDDLQSEIWDLPRLRGLVKDVVSGAWKERMLPTAYLMARIHTLDLLLR